MKINEQTQKKWSRFLIKFLPDSEKFLYRSNNTETMKYIDSEFFSLALENLDCQFELENSQINFYDYLQDTLNTIEMSLNNKPRNVTVLDVVALFISFLGLQLFFYAWRQLNQSKRNTFLFFDFLDMLGSSVIFWLFLIPPTLLTAFTVIWILFSLINLCCFFNYSMDLIFGTEYRKQIRYFDTEF